MSDMATEQSSLPVNGNYIPHQAAHGYGMAEQNYTSHSANNSLAADYGGPTTTTGAASGSSGGNDSIPKDEVGWYFVEQYYTTMSRSPEKLFVSLWHFAGP